MAKRVLVVDDNKSQVATLRMFLGQRGYETQGHHDALTILARVREFDPDVVVLDLAMPGKSGFEAAREIRAAIPGKRPALIALTVEEKKPPEFMHWANPFDHYLIKPVDPTVLVALIETAP